MSLAGLLSVTNGDMGTSLCERNGLWAHTCSQRLSFSTGLPRPTFGFTLGSKKVKLRSYFFSLRTHSGRPFDVLLKVQSANRSIDSGLLEKESEFKPSFEEYLKAMESVKTERGEKQMGSSIRNPKNADGSRLGDFKAITRNGITGQEEHFGGQIDAKERGSREVTNAKKLKFEGDRLEVPENKIDARKNGKLDRDARNGRWERNKINGVRNGQRNGEMERIRFKTDNGTLKGIRMRQGLRRNCSVPDETMAGRDVQFRRRNWLIAESINNGEVEVERAAFKSLEELNDVADKPRVTRKEMDERIEKLARCLNGMDINMPEWMFSKMMRSARIKFSDYAMLRIIQILGKLGNWRRVLQLIEWLQLHDRFKSHKLRYIYTTALDVLGKARRPVEALNLFCAMKQQVSTYPDLVAYHCIAVTLGQAGHMKELFEVIDSMRSPPKKKFKTGVLEKWDPRLEPDSIVYNAVLNACVRRKQWEGAFWVLQQLKEQGQQPSCTTYGLVMEVMFACGKYNLVHDFFKKAIKSSIPNALTYKDMERRGIVGSAALYYDLARCLCSAGRCQEALVKIDKICNVANKPLVVTYTGLIKACLDAGNIQNGAYIFNHMLKFCSPNLVTCNIMLKAYLEHGKFEEAKGLFLRMLEDGNFVSNIADYKDKVIPDIYTFNILLDACMKEQRWEDLEFVYKQMLHYGYHFNAKRHLRMIMNACRAGKVELLETTWKHLAQAGRTPPPILMKEMFCTKLEQGDHAAALSLFSGHHYGELQVFSHNAWLNCLKENTHRFQKATVVRLVHEGSILASRGDSQHLVFQNLVTASEEFLRTNKIESEIEHTNSPQTLMKQL
ncbi:pentatricopeptide repeat-containing protein At1g30610, chloroplastic isoform X6 [Diospyros lotus]|uniref:pentatricopeptide repeat-containing protein At1g30610, chloroplastic isoform X4 n=1 Tax=Diospyros lotus TaxID=55363 RepID=UPI00224FC54F|nr:pentatricopeptide repeat-containing protein At1g30610, chloroplastic isoform X4 [Diospyros lotus]XP_052202098.1 pentatricopeptide repeat-containing protein At1g30610, chloroplastic isoform X5 [Diospyros lotus]XP_052202099.1 pentatricopeptide repeat-containing protein At1g30610, chloroplastic isoform X6 [Diospyros lotus]